MLRVNLAAIACHAECSTKIIYTPETSKYRDGKSGRMSEFVDADCGRLKVLILEPPLYHLTGEFVYNKDKEDCLKI